MDASLVPLFTELRARQQGTWAAVGEVNRTHGLAADSIKAAQAALATLTEAQTGLYDVTDRIRAAADPLITAPVVVPVAPPADPNAMPTDALPGWKQVFAEDFGTDVALGAAKTELGKKGWSFYDGFKDTVKKGLYNTARTVSVKGGTLRVNLHSENGQPLIACLVPQGYTGQMYGRYAVRFRADAVPGYKIAWMLWPKSDKWSEGEVDFPEADLTGNIWGFSHALGNPNVNAAWVDTKTAATDWHTAVIEWLPGSLTYLLDGKVVMTTTEPKAIPKTPMRWTMQCETKLDNSVVPLDAAGNIEIAWLTVHTAAA